MRSSSCSVNPTDESEPAIIAFAAPAMSKCRMSSISRAPSPRIEEECRRRVDWERISSSHDTLSDRSQECRNVRLVGVLYGETYAPGQVVEPSRFNRLVNHSISLTAVTFYIVVHSICSNVLRSKVGSIA